MSTYTEFGPDRLRFAGLKPERLIFRPKKSMFNSVRLLLIPGLSDIPGNETANQLAKQTAS